MINKQNGVVLPEMSELFAARALKGREQPAPKSRLNLL